jgi:hypothetical protein
VSTTLGPGGDCDANGIWIIESTPHVAFVGDLVFNGTHMYTADDHVLAWLANLEIARNRPLTAREARVAVAGAR